MLASFGTTPIGKIADHLHRELTSAAKGLVRAGASHFWQRHFILTAIVLTLLPTVYGLVRAQRGT